MSANCQQWPDPRESNSYQWWAQVPIAKGVDVWREVFGAAETLKIGEGVAASVVIPVFNAAPYLPQLLSSFSAQTLENIEVICVDDGSTDESRTVCEAFAAYDTRFKVVSQANQGAAAARNKGLAMAAGKWVFFSDADDFCRPDMLADMVAAGEKGADVVVAGRHYLDFQGRHKGFKKSVPRGYFALGETLTCETEGMDIFAGLGHVAWNKLYRRDFLLAQGLRFYSLPSSNDITFVLCSLLRASRIRLLARNFYFYREGNPDSIVGGMDSSPTAFLEAWGAVGREVAGRSARLQNQFFTALVRTGFWHMTHKRTREGIEAVYKALRDGGLDALKGDAVDVQTLNLGLVRDAYDALMRRDPLELVLLALFQARKTKLDAARQDLAKSKKKVAKLEKEVKELKESVGELENEAKELKGKVAKLEVLKERIAMLKESEAAIKGSFSYRAGRLLTAPFRKVRALFSVNP